MTGAGAADGGDERQKEKGKWKVDSTDDLSFIASSNGRGKSSPSSNAAPQPSFRNLPPPPPALGPVYINPPSADIPELASSLQSQPLAPQPQTTPATTAPSTPTPDRSPLKVPRMLRELVVYSSVMSVFAS
ncbi:hypothetical protein BDW75DRAFT_243271 [Aspergillus navahoensis]